VFLSSAVFQSLFPSPFARVAGRGAGDASRFAERAGHRVAGQALPPPSLPATQPFLLSEHLYLEAHLSLSVL
jgi:hypothetical protein